MAHVTFDTLQFVEELIAAGMPAEQAKALSIVQKRAFEETIDAAALATKVDIADLKREIKSDVQQLKAEMRAGDAHAKADNRLLQWMIGFVFAGVGTLILKAFFS